MAKSRCNKCRVETQDSDYCGDCYYPGIEQDYQEYKNLLADGHPRHQAAVLSGWRGAEEFSRHEY